MTGPGDSESRKTSDRAAIIVPSVRGEDVERSLEARLAETGGLAEAIGLDVVFGDAVRVTRINPSTLLGPGAVAELGQRLDEAEIDLAIIDQPLSAIQQRNLENRWKLKVIDRTGLILEIFGSRARTREGQLQVELAHLDYQRSRLVRSWTHLERQRGGAGFLGGPGERQIELDRRLIGQRIDRLKGQLAEVRRTRGLHRQARERVPYPVIALVGYTNAGKSTLFNRLTGARVMARDMLFATLDPTMRAIDIGRGEKVILSDTVGFIADLPTHLVAAFQATLEEVVNADLILHVRDIASEESDLQRNNVRAVLDELGVRDENPPLLEVWNKADLLSPEAAAQVAASCGSESAPVLISALTGEGLDDLKARLLSRMTSGHRQCDLSVPAADGRLLAWLHRKGRVLTERLEDETIHIRVLLEPADADRLEAGRIFRPEGQAE